MHEHWKYHGPPTYMTLAIVHGIFKKKKKTVQHKKTPSGRLDPKDFGDPADLIRMFSGSGGVIRMN